MSLIDVLDEKGNPTGEQATATEVHQKGLWHKTAWVWIYNSRGEILIQKRAKTKRMYPELWDISAAGHVDAGEESLDAALRELEEELGIKAKPKDLKSVGIVVDSAYLKESGLYNNEFNYVYLYRFDGDTEKLSLQEREVEAIKFIELDEFFRENSDGKMSKMYVPHGNHYKDVVNNIKVSLSE